MPKLPADFRPGLRPPQFRLSTLMWLIALLCAMFAMIAWVGPYGTLVLIVFVLAVIAHIAGNAIGTKLRENGDRPVAPEDHRGPLKLPLNRPATKDEFAPTTQLSERKSLGLTNLIMTCLGIVLGASVGGFCLTLLNWDRITLPSLIFAVVACGVLGGIGGFATSSFVHVLIGAQLQAMRQAKRR